MTGKRRGDGPTVRRPAQHAAASLRRCGWASGLFIVGIVWAVVAAGQFVILYKAIEVPDPNEDFQTQTSFIYYSDGKTGLGRFAHPEPRSSP